MSILKNIFARIWAVWGIILFIITMLIVFPFFLCCFFFKEPARGRISHKLYGIWMAIYLPLTGIFVSIKGKHHFEKGKNYIVLCNHNSLIDIPVSTPRIPGANKTIAKIEMAKIPLFGVLYKLGSVLVDRKDKDSRRKSFLLMKEVLDMGLHMCIYPEGTRNKTGQPLKEFHDGAFKLAADTGKPLLPAILFGTAAILPNDKSFYLMPGSISFHFLQPVEVKTGEDPEALKNRVFKIMWDHFSAGKTGSV